MIGSHSEETGFWGISFRLFSITFPFLIFGRIVGKWFLSENMAEIRAWIRAEWIAELVIALILASFVSLFDGYRKWLGPSYGSREDRHET